LFFFGQRSATPSPARRSASSLQVGQNRLGVVGAGQRADKALNPAWQH
jgi:hypothetical protein